MKLFVACLALVSTAPAAEPETIYGVLMDASCKAIASRNEADTNSDRQAGSGKGGSERVREKYRDCMVRASTTKFAMHSDGKLYVIDHAGNEMIAQQMRNEAFRAAMTDRTGAPKWMSVTVLGAVTGDRIALTSVRK